MGFFSFLKGIRKEEEIEKEPEDLVLTEEFVKKMKELTI